MKLAWNRALAVGVLAALTGIAFLLAITFFRKGGFSEKDSYLVYGLFSDATGLTWKSRVQIAGIQVGEVSQITLQGARARLDIRVKKEIELHSDACLTKAFPSALLPDALLEVQPGSLDRPLLKSLPEEQRVITCIREAASVQALMDSMSKIALDVQSVTGDLAKTVSGEMGLRQIVENLASATRRIDEAIAQNEQNVEDLIDNVRGFSADLRDITERDKGKIGRIASNVEELTRRLNMVAASLQEIIDPGAAGAKPAPGGEAVAPGTAAALAQASPEERQHAAQQARGVREAVDRLTGSLSRLEDVISKVNEGKGIAGKLIADERLGRKVGVATEEIADQIDRVYRMQVQLQLRSEWLLNQTLQNEGRPGTKIYFGARLLPRPDKFYLLEVVSDPRGVDSVTTETVSTRLPDGTTQQQVTTSKVNEQKLTYSLQLGKRYGPVTFRIGVIENSGGGGADLHLFHDSLQLSASVYQFSRAFQDVNLAGTERMLYPRAKVWLNWYFLQHFFLTTGVDDFFNRWQQGQYPGGRSFNIGTDVFFGGGLFFTDEDLKTLLGAGVGSAIPRGG